MTHQTTPLAFVDCETTGIHPARRPWEIAIIRREPDGQERTMHAFVADIDLSQADPFGLRVGRFYDRHPGFNGSVDDVLIDDPWHGYSPGEMPSTARNVDEIRVAGLVERMTRGAHLVGAVPNFDAETFDAMLRRHQLIPAWHHHLIDVEALAVGALCGGGYLDTPPLPWKSDDLSRALGVEPPSEQDRHTALGDALWAMRLYDTITGYTAPTGRRASSRVVGGAGS